MKSKLQIQAPAAILFLALSLAVAQAQTAQTAPSNAPAVNPATALPAGGGSSITPDFNPFIVPVAPPAPQWIDPNWSDPDIVLTNVDYDGLPLSEVARNLRERFKDNFDILPMPKTFGKDWDGETIHLQLKNVRASEIFNAMNLVFENDRTPLRWELKSIKAHQATDQHVHRWVQLRVLPEVALRDIPQIKPPETHRMVYFVGNLVGDEKSGGMTMAQLTKTILKIWPTELGNQPDSILQFHEDAQLLVVNGTREQLDFIQQTLHALQQKVEWEHLKPASAGSGSKTDKPKSDLKSGADGAK
jgi:hypothetical protein